MKISDKIRELKETAVRLEQEKAVLSAALDKKRSELKGLSEGVDKYKASPVLAENLKKILKQKMKELKEMRTRIEELKSDQQKQDLEIKRLYSHLNRKQKETQAKRIEIKAVQIAASPAVEAALEKAMSTPPQTAKIVSKLVVEEMAEVAEKKAEPKVISTPPKVAKPKKDLYQQAASEAEAQEKYLKSQTPKFFGNI